MMEHFEFRIMYVLIKMLVVASFSMWFLNNDYHEMTVDAVRIVSSRKSSMVEENDFSQQFLTTSTTSSTPTMLEVVGTRSENLLQVDDKSRLGVGSSNINTKASTATTIIHNHKRVTESVLKASIQKMLSRENLLYAFMKQHRILGNVERVARQNDQSSADKLDKTKSEDPFKISDDILYRNTYEDTTSQNTIDDSLSLKQMIDNEKIYQKLGMRVELDETKHQSALPFSFIEEKIEEKNALTRLTNSELLFDYSETSAVMATVCETVNSWIEKYICGGAAKIVGSEGLGGAVKESTIGALRDRLTQQHQQNSTTEISTADFVDKVTSSALVQDSASLCGMNPLESLKFCGAQLQENFHAILHRDDDGSSHSLSRGHGPKGVGNTREKRSSGMGGATMLSIFSHDSSLKSEKSSEGNTNTNKRAGALEMESKSVVNVANGVTITKSLHDETASDNAAREAERKLVSGKVYFDGVDGNFDGKGLQTLPKNTLLGELLSDVKLTYEAYESGKFTWKIYDDAWNALYLDATSRDIGEKSNFLRYLRCDGEVQSLKKKQDGFTDIPKWVHVLTKKKKELKGLASFLEIDANVTTVNDHSVSLLDFSAGSDEVVGKFVSSSPVAAADRDLDSKKDVGVESSPVQPSNFLETRREVAIPISHVQRRNSSPSLDEHLEYNDVDYDDREEVSNDDDDDSPDSPSESQDAKKFKKVRSEFLDLSNELAEQKEKELKAERAVKKAETALKQARSREEELEEANLAILAAEEEARLAADEEDRRRHAAESAERKNPLENKHQNPHIGSRRGKFFEEKKQTNRHYDDDNDYDDSSPSESDAEDASFFEEDEVSDEEGNDRQRHVRKRLHKHQSSHKGSTKKKRKSSKKFKNAGQEFISDLSTLAGNVRDAGSALKNFEWSKYVPNISSPTSIFSYFGKKNGKVVGHHGKNRSGHHGKIKKRHRHKTPKSIRERNMPESFVEEENESVDIVANTSKKQLSTSEIQKQNQLLLKQDLMLLAQGVKFGIEKLSGAASVAYENIGKLKQCKDEKCNGEMGVSRASGSKGRNLKHRRGKRDDESERRQEDSEWKGSEYDDEELDSRGVSYLELSSVEEYVEPLQALSMTDISVSSQQDSQISAASQQSQQQQNLKTKSLSEAEIYYEWLDEKKPAEIDYYYNVEPVIFEDIKWMRRDQIDNEGNGLLELGQYPPASSNANSQDPTLSSRMPHLYLELGEKEFFHNESMLELVESDSKTGNVSDVGSRDIKGVKAGRGMEGQASVAGSDDNVNDYIMIPLEGDSAAAVSFLQIGSDSEEEENRSFLEVGRLDGDFREKMLKVHKAKTVQEMSMRTSASSDAAIPVGTQTAKTQEEDHSIPDLSHSSILFKRRKKPPSQLGQNGRRLRQSSSFSEVDDRQSYSAEHTGEENSPTTHRKYTYHNTDSTSHDISGTKDSVPEANLMKVPISDEAVGAAGQENSSEKQQQHFIKMPKADFVKFVQKNFVPEVKGYRLLFFATEDIAKDSELIANCDQHPRIAELLSTVPREWRIQEKELFFDPV